VMPNGPVPVVQVRELVDLVETRNRMLGHESPSSRSDHRHRNWAVAHPGTGSLRDLGASTVRWCPRGS
jgi:hypothetical protein